MRVISLNASGWRSPEAFYSVLLPELGAPAWHGHNLNALDESLRFGGLNAVEPPFRVEVEGADKLSDGMQRFISEVEQLFADIRAETRKQIYFELG